MGAILHCLSAFVHLALLTTKERRVCICSKVGHKQRSEQNSIEGKNDSACTLGLPLTFHVSRASILVIIIIIKGQDSLTNLIHVA